VKPAVTVEELAAYMAERGTPITRAVLRYHCRDRNGQLYGIAWRAGSTWRIPVDAARRFAAQYRPWGSLHGPRKTAEAGDATPSPASPHADHDRDQLQHPTEGQ
jgi:hypothetical protein